MADHRLWPLILLLALCPVSISGNVFVSIDCGASGSFTDENSIVWRGDGDLISNGDTHVVQSNYSISRVYDTLRVFTTRKKNCYSIEAEEGGKVLVRASFNYGNYDQKSSPPVFDLLFDGNFWITVNTSEPKVYEAIYVVKRKLISVCVAQKNPNQFPFISSLEVRSMDLQVYKNIGTNYALLTNTRTAYAINETIRFPKDPYDRGWVPAIIGSGLVNVTNEASIVDVNVLDNPPPAVLQNAIQTPNTSQIITLGLGTIEYPIRYPVYINWYFSEVKELNSSESRSFRIYMDNKPFSLPIVPHFGNVTEYFITNLTVTPESNFSLNALGDSTLPPLISAAEIFSISDPLTDGTNNNDGMAVEGLVSLQKTFDVLQEWGGDPCLPVPYSWEWIQCNNDRVTSINLSGFNLSGSLPDFSNMDALEVIDLHDNRLSGSVPDFLGNLPNLKQLNLADNEFSGSLPSSLSRNSKIKLSDTGNPLLCTNGGKTWCPGAGAGSGKHKKKSSKLPLILGITIPVLLLSLAMMGVLVFSRKASSIPGGGSQRGTRGGGGDEELERYTEERFYRSPAPLLAEGTST